jgi:hypothetical protein
VVGALKAMQPNPLEPYLSEKGKAVAASAVR